MSNYALLRRFSSSVPGSVGSPVFAILCFGVEIFPSSRQRAASGAPGRSCILCQSCVPPELRVEFAHLNLQVNEEGSEERRIRNPDRPQAPFRRAGLRFPDEMRVRR